MTTAAATIFLFFSLRQTISLRLLRPKRVSSLCERERRRRERSTDNGEREELRCYGSPKKTLTLRSVSRLCITLKALLRPTTGALHSERRYRSIEEQRYKAAASATLRVDLSYSRTLSLSLNGKKKLSKSESDSIHSGRQPFPMMPDHELVAVGIFG